MSKARRRFVPNGQVHGSVALAIADVGRGRCPQKCLHHLWLVGDHCQMQCCLDNRETTVVRMSRTFRSFNTLKNGESVRKAAGKPMQLDIKELKAPHK